jgi:ribonuclease P protein component
MSGSQDMTAFGGGEPLGAVSCVAVAMPPRLQVMTKRADFVAANSGLRVARGGVVLQVRPNADDALRFGITVTKRIGNAVVRNRMKRRLRALVRELLPVHGLPGHDHVLIGREGGVERDFARMRDELLVALERARAGKGDPPRAPRGPKGKRPAQKPAKPKG